MGVNPEISSGARRKARLSPEADTSSNDPRIPRQLNRAEQVWRWCDEQSYQQHECRRRLKYGHACNKSDIGAAEAQCSN